MLHSLPTKENEQFMAVCQGVTDWAVQVAPGNMHGLGQCMVVCTEDAAIYITKEQARIFFGLQDRGYN